MGTPSPAAQVERTLVEQLTVTWRKEDGGEDDKRIGPNEEGVLHTPPLVIEEMTLCVCVCVLCLCVSVYVCVCGLYASK